MSTTSTSSTSSTEKPKDLEQPPWVTTYGKVKDFGRTVKTPPYPLIEPYKPISVEKPIMEIRSILFKRDPDCPELNQNRTKKKVRFTHETIDYSRELKPYKYHLLFSSRPRFLLPTPQSYLAYKCPPVYTDIKLPPSSLAIGRRPGPTLDHFYGSPKELSTRNAIRETFTPPHVRREKKQLLIKQQLEEEAEELKQEKLDFAETIESQSRNLEEAHRLATKALNLILAERAEAEALELARKKELLDFKIKLAEQAVAIAVGQELDLQSAAIRAEFAGMTQEEAIAYLAQPTSPSATALTVDFVDFTEHAVNPIESPTRASQRRVTRLKNLIPQLKQAHMTYNSLISSEPKDLFLLDQIVIRQIIGLDLALTERYIKYALELTQAMANTTAYMMALYSKFFYRADGSNHDLPMMSSKTDRGSESNMHMIASVVGCLNRISGDRPKTENHLFSVETLLVKLQLEMITLIICPIKSVMFRAVLEVVPSTAKAAYDVLMERSKFGQGMIWIGHVDGEPPVSEDDEDGGGVGFKKILHGLDEPELPNEMMSEASAVKWVNNSTLYKSYARIMRAIGLSEKPGPVTYISCVDVPGGDSASGKRGY